MRLNVYDLRTWRTSANTVLAHTSAEEQMLVLNSARRMVKHVERGAVIRMEPVSGGIEQSQSHLSHWSARMMHSKRVTID